MENQSHMKSRCLGSSAARVSFLCSHSVVTGRFEKPFNSKELIFLPITTSIWRVATLEVVIIAANRFTSALYVLCIRQQIHVLQRISAMQPIIVQLYGNLENLHLVFVLRSTISVCCSTNVCVFCIRNQLLSITFSNPFSGPSWFVLLGLYGCCPWVSIAPSLGSLWLLFLGVHGS